MPHIPSRFDQIIAVTSQRLRQMLLGHFDEWPKFRMVKLRNGQIVEMFVIPLKQNYLDITCWLDMLIFLHFVFMLSWLTQWCFSCQCKKRLLINSTIHQTEHSSILLCISDTSNAEEILIGQEKLKKRIDIGTLHTLLSFIFFACPQAKINNKMAGQ